MTSFREYIEEAVKVDEAFEILKKSLLAFEKDNNKITAVKKSGSNIVIDLELNLGWRDIENYSGGNIINMSSNRKKEAEQEAAETMLRKLELFNLNNVKIKIVKTRSFNKSYGSYYIEADTVFNIQLKIAIEDITSPDIINKAEQEAEKIIEGLKKSYKNEKTIKYILGLIYPALKNVEMVKEKDGFFLDPKWKLGKEQTGPVYSLVSAYSTGGRFSGAPKDIFEEYLRRAYIEFFTKSYKLEDKANYPKISTYGTGNHRIVITPQ